MCSIYQILLLSVTFPWFGKESELSSLVHRTKFISLSETFCDFGRFSASLLRRPFFASTLLEQVRYCSQLWKGCCLSFVAQTFLRFGKTSELVLHSTFERVGHNAALLPRWLHFGRRLTSWLHFSRRLTSWLHFGRRLTSWLHFGRRPQFCTAIYSTQVSKSYESNL